MSMSSSLTLGGLISVEALYLSYLLFYLFLTFAVAGFFGGVGTLQAGWLAGRAQLASLTLVRLRWVWLTLLVSLAGLPPAFFFGPKLGLLSFLLERGSFVLTLGLLLGIFLGWAGYFVLGHRTLGGSLITISQPVRYVRVSPSFALSCFFLVTCLVFGFIFIDELFLLVLWLA